MSKPNRAMANLAKNPALGLIRVDSKDSGENIVAFIKSSGGKASLRSRRLGPRKRPIINWNVHVFSLGNLTRDTLNKSAERLGFSPVAQFEWDGWALWEGRANDQ